MKLVINQERIRKSVTVAVIRHKNQWIAACMAVVCGFGNISLSSALYPGKLDSAYEKKESDGVNSGYEATSSEAVLTDESENNDVWKPSLYDMNLFHISSEGETGVEVADSIGAQIFNDLATKDTQWSSAVYSYQSLKPEDMVSRYGISSSYIKGEYDPSDASQDPEDPFTWLIRKFRNVWFMTVDGDGNTISADSNIPQIMAMANVYTYYHDPGNSELFKTYAESLWQASHSYTMGVSGIYHCLGCVDPDAVKNKTATPSQLEAESIAQTDTNALTPTEVYIENATDTVETTAETTAVTGETAIDSTETMSSAAETENQNTSSTSESNTDSAQTADGSKKLICPGHVDLTITMKIAGVTEKNSLFELDSIGNSEENMSEDGWQGWTEENRQAVKLIAGENWYQRYGLTVPSVSTKFALNSAEVETYMDELPTDLSETRKELIRFALESVGKVPYYWGGKASAKNYEGNNFGSLVSPDAKGRMLKGLDCSGWISWVYWSVTGNKLPYQSTSGMVNMGTRISREELKPGDILLRTGNEGHVVMFLGWTQDGKIRCVHETAGSVDNVTVSIRDANWPYYIRLVD